MKKIISLTVCSILIAASSVFAQVPADSLKGTYAGILMYKNVSSAPWTIVPDTLLVSWIDSVNCLVGVGLCGGQLMPLFSIYTYCSSPTQGNYYANFYSMDSITAIADSNTLQPPCQQPSDFSVRFYGKRISSDWGLGVIKNNNKTPQLIVYPNPLNTILFIEYKMFQGETELQITDVAGQEVKSVQMSSPQMQIDISGLANGSYFVNVNTANGVLTKKIVVQR